MTITRSPMSRMRPQRSRIAVRWLIRVAILAVVFGLGVAVGQAIEDRPRAGKPVTNVTTISPWTQTQTQP